MKTEKNGIRMKNVLKRERLYTSLTRSLFSVVQASLGDSIENFKIKVQKVQFGLHHIEHNFDFRNQNKTVCELKGHINNKHCVTFFPSLYLAIPYKHDG